MENAYEMRVTKRDGSLEDVFFDKILNRIKKIGKEANIHINYSSLVMKVIDQLYNNITTEQIDVLTAEQCAAMSTIHVDYSTLASSIIISNLHKKTDKSFYKTMKKAYEFKDINGKPSPLINKKFWNFANLNLSANLVPNDILFLNNLLVKILINKLKLRTNWRIDLRTYKVNYKVTSPLISKWNK